MSLFLGACNSLLGISTPVEISADASNDSVVTLVLDANPDGADARPDAMDASSDARDAGPDVANASSDGADARSDGTDAAPDGADGPSDGDASDTSPPPALVITPATLPDARFNVAYSVKFTATGGTAVGQLWTVTSGRLPAGIDLELDGTLQGVPLEEGTFPVEVTVAEVPPGTSQGTAHLMLTVVRKHWLAYLANPEQSNSFGIFAVNVRSPSVQMKVSTNVPAVSGTVEKFDFSADGKYIAYVASLATGVNLYVVDMTGEQPGTPRKVNEYGGVDGFAWSAEGRYLAFDDLNDQGTTAILVADMTQPLSHPVQAATGTGNTNDIGFVTDELLTYWLQNLAFARRSANGLFGAPQLLTVYGSLVQRWPDLESALFASNGESCQDPTWNLIDFRSPLTMRQLVGYVSASPGRDFIAHRENSAYQYNIYSTWGTVPLSSFPSASHFCSPGGWSHDGKLFVAGGDDDTLQITTIDGATATTSPLPGDYGTVAENGPPTFSPDDHWLGFSTNQGAFVVRNNHGSLGAAMGGGVAVTQQFGQPRLAFSPDSTHLASGEASSMGRPASVRMTDLRLDPPATVEVGLGTAAGSGVNLLAWSVHSTEAAFVVHNGYYPSTSPMPTDLYLYLLPTSSPQSAPFIQNVTNFASCDMYSIACGLVTDIEFQP